MKTMKNLMLLIAIAMITITAPSCKKATPVEPQNAKVVQQLTYKQKWGKYFSNQTWNFVATPASTTAYPNLVSGTYKFPDATTYVGDASVSFQDWMTINGNNTIATVYTWSEGRGSNYSAVFAFYLSGISSKYFVIVSVDDHNLIAQEVLFDVNGAMVSADSSKIQLTFTK